MYSMGTINTTDPHVPNDINQSQLADPYSSPFIKPSVFPGSHQQHQPYTTVVNSDPLMTNPNVFHWSSSSSAHQHPVMLNQQQQPRFNPLSVPQTGVPWKCPDWMVNQNIQPGSYMSFNGQQHTRLPFKRKGEPEIDTTIQSKQLITEEKMAAHLNGLHISSEFKAHDINRSTNDSDTFDVEITTNDSVVPIPYPTTLQDIEEKLKRAQKITVADVVKSIQDEPLLPAAIIERFEKPCKALVVWQPPQRITDLIVSESVQVKQTSDDESNDNNNDDNNSDNNDVEFMDANNDAEMELDS